MWRPHQKLTPRNLNVYLYPIAPSSRNTSSTFDIRVLDMCGVAEDAERIKFILVFGEQRLTSESVVLLLLLCTKRCRAGEREYITDSEHERGQTDTNSRSRRPSHILYPNYPIHISSNFVDSTTSHSIMSSLARSKMMVRVAILDQGPRGDI